MTTTTEEPTGLVHGIPDAEYHAMPGLSATGMKWILRSPKHYRQMIDHRVDKKAFDFGHAVHAKILGVGMDVVVIPDSLLAKNGATSTLEAKAFITQARADGLVPVKAEVIAELDAIAEAVLAHPKASTLLESPGHPEVSLFGRDPETGVRLRGRIDYLTDATINVDVKTTTDVRRHKLARTIADFGYDIQSEAYRHLLRINGLEPQPTHLIFVETDPPHEVRVVQLDGWWIEGGQRRMREAIDTYAQCITTNTWPGDDDQPGEPEPIEPPAYYIYDTDDSIADDIEVI
jgi:hypothetical protein